MKKIYGFFILSLACISVHAQVKSSRLIENSQLKSKSTRTELLISKKASRSTVSQAVDVSNIDYSVGTFSSIKSAVRARVKAADTISTSYGRPDGAFFEGYTRDYKAYSTTLYMHSPAVTTVDYAPWASDNTAKFSWAYNGGSFAAITDSMDNDGTLHFSANITPDGYISYMPKVTAKTSYDDASFVIGQGVTSQYLLAGSVSRTATADGTSFAGVDELSPMTLCNMHENKPTSGNLYGSFSAGGSYSPAYSTTDGACKGFMQIIPKLVSPFYMESTSLLAYEYGGTAVPAGGVMKIQFYYVNADGSLGELIGESTTNEFVKTYSTQGAFIFKFQKEEDGFTTDAPITLGTKAPIAVLITGFDSTWHFRALFGVNKTLGSSYTLHGDNLSVSTFGYSNATTTPRSDLYLQYNGMFNCLALADSKQSVAFPGEGGWGVAGYDDKGAAFNDVDLYSSYQLDNDMTNVWLESAPQWVTGLDTDTTYFADYNVVMFYFKAEALPEGVNSRSGEIVLSSYGVSAKIPVTQSATTAVEVVKSSGLKVAAEANCFKLTYPAGFNSVEVYTITGQQLGKYTLSSSGSATIPADKAHGSYLLRFTGASTSTIKIMK